MGLLSKDKEESVKMDDEALQKQSDPITVGEFAWKIRDALEYLNANCVVLPRDETKKTEMFSSLMNLLSYWAMCAGGTVTFDPPSDVDVPEDDSKELVDETKDEVQDKSGMKRPRCNGGFPRDDDDSQPNSPVAKRKKTKKKSCVKLNRKVNPKMGGSKCRKESSSSSSASCFEVEVVEDSPVATSIPSSSSSSSSDDDSGGKNTGQTGYTSTSESEEDE